MIFIEGLHKYRTYQNCDLPINLVSEINNDDFLENLNNQGKLCRDLDNYESHYTKN